MIAKTWGLWLDWHTPKVQPVLRRLAADADRISFALFDKPICITNVRDDVGVTTTHSEGRALDIRTTTPSGWDESSDIATPGTGDPYLTDEEASLLERAINVKWSLNATFGDGTRMKPAYRHGGTADHIHLQVARNGVLERRV